MPAMPQTRGRRGQPQPGGGEGQAGTPARAAIPAVPFDQAAHEGGEQAARTYTFTPGASQQQFGPDPVPAQGFIRRVILDVAATGGTGGTARADAPFSLLALVRLADTNGAPIVELSGYNLFLSNLFGRYVGASDPRQDPDYVGTTPNFSFALTIPVEIAPTGLGSLSNESASAAYRLTVIAAAIGDTWSANPAPVPSVAVNVFTEYWTAPGPADALGRPQQQYPPYHGTAQYWSQQPNVSVNAGQNTTRITRVGDLIRQVIAVARTSQFVRADTPFPDPLTLNWNHRDLRINSQRVLRKLMREALPSVVDRPAGVFVLDFSKGEERFSGGNGVNSWLATVSATRFDLVGPSGASGTLDLLVNDVSVAAVAPAERVLETGTGYVPPVGTELVGQT